MALATVNATPITVQADHKAAYALILAQSGGTVPEASQSLVLIFPDGVVTTVAANAIASTGTDATGLFTTPVSLIPGCVYSVACPNDTGDFATTRFIAPSIVGKVITAGAAL